MYVVDVLQLSDSSLFVEAVLKCILVQVIVHRVVNDSHQKK